MQLPRENGLVGQGETGYFFAFVLLALAVMTQLTDDLVMTLCSSRNIPSSSRPPLLKLRAYS